MNSNTPKRASSRLRNLRRSSNSHSRVASCGRRVAPGEVPVQATLRAAIVEPGPDHAPASGIKARAAHRRYVVSTAKLPSCLRRRWSAVGGAVEPIIEEVDAQGVAASASRTPCAGSDRAPARSLGHRQPRPASNGLAGEATLSSGSRRPRPRRCGAMHGAGGARGCARQLVEDGHRPRRGLGNGTAFFIEDVGQRVGDGGRGSDSR